MGYNRTGNSKKGRVVGSMRFESYNRDGRVLPKVFEFDSSPGRAISQALGPGQWDERSFESILLENNFDGTVRLYEARLRRKVTETSPGPHKLEKVGTISWQKPL